MVRYQIIQSGGLYDHQTKTIIPPNRNTEAWKEYETWLTAGNSPLPPDIIGQDDLATAKLKRQVEIDAFASGLRNQAVRGRSAGEMASWTMKMIEAKTYLATNDPLQAPLLASIATIRGITITELANRVMSQSSPFLQAEAYIDGVRGKHCDTIEAMLDVRDIVTYNWHTGWPTIP